VLNIAPAVPRQASRGERPSPRQNRAILESALRSSPRDPNPPPAVGVRRPSRPRMPCHCATRPVHTQLRWRRRPTSASGASASGRRNRAARAHAVAPPTPRPRRRGPVRAQADGRLSPIQIVKGWLAVVAHVIRHRDVRLARGVSIEPGHRHLPPASTNAHHLARRGRGYPRDLRQIRSFSWPLGRAGALLDRTSMTEPGYRLVVVRVVVGWTDSGVGGRGGCVKSKSAARLPRMGWFSRTSGRGSGRPSVVGSRR
jgi:hypothetical protein